MSTPTGARHYRVNTRTVLPGVGILQLGEKAGLICNFSLNVAAHQNSLSRFVPEMQSAGRSDVKQPRIEYLYCIYMYIYICVYIYRGFPIRTVYLYNDI